jgi:hypothetical protein
VHGLVELAPGTGGIARKRQCFCGIAEHLAAADGHAEPHVHFVALSYRPISGLRITHARHCPAPEPTIRRLAMNERVPLGDGLQLVRKLSDSLGVVHPDLEQGIEPERHHLCYWLTEPSGACVRGSYALTRLVGEPELEQHDRSQTEYGNSGLEAESRVRSFIERLARRNALEPFAHKARPAPVVQSRA